MQKLETFSKLLGSFGNFLLFRVNLKENRIYGILLNFLQEIINGIFLSSNSFILKWITSKTRIHPTF